MKEQIAYKFPSGLEVTGSIEEIVLIAKSLKVEVDWSKLGSIPAGYYPSESKGLIKVAEMPEFHLRRALLKRAKDYYAEIYNPEDTVERFLIKFMGLTDDRIINDLFNELQKRR